MRAPSRTLRFPFLSGAAMHAGVKAATLRARGQCAQERQARQVDAPPPPPPPAHRDIMSRWTEVMLQCAVTEGRERK